MRKRHTIRDTVTHDMIGERELLGRGADQMKVLDRGDRVVVDL